MGWLKQAVDELEQERSLSGGGEGGAAKGLAHPIKELLTFLQGTDPALVAHSYKQSDDGSKSITFELPSRSEIEKKKAMELAEQQVQSQGGGNVVQMPADAPPAGGNEMATAAKNNVKVKVAMTKKDVINEFPKAFVRAMGF